jgi:thymidylate synthase
MEIRATTQSEAWIAAVRATLGAPVIAPRGMKVREVPERVSLVIERPDDTFVHAEGRSFNHTITAVEGLSLVGQTNVPELLTDRVSALAPYQNGAIFWGAYGPRIAGDVGNVVELLKRDPDSRQAVLSIFDSDRDLGRPEVKDVPCTIAIQFFLRPNGSGSRDLHMWVMMRSQDVWLGTPYDLGQFSLLQMAMAQALDAGVGTYTHTLGSLHIYEKHWTLADVIGEPKTVYNGNRWGGDGTIADIAMRARRLLLGDYLMLDGMTPLELWINQKIQR